MGPTVHGTNRCTKRNVASPTASCADVVMPCTGATSGSTRRPKMVLFEVFLLAYIHYPVLLIIVESGVRMATSTSTSGSRIHPSTMALGQQNKTREELSRDHSSILLNAELATLRESGGGGPFVGAAWVSMSPVSAELVPALQVANGCMPIRVL